MWVLRREAGGLVGALLAHAALCFWLARPASLALTARLEEPSNPVDVEIEPPPATERPPVAPAAPKSPTEPALPPSVSAALAPTLTPSQATPAPESPPTVPATAASGPFTFSPTIAPSLASEPLGMSGRNPFIGNLPDVPSGPAAPDTAAPEANVAPGIQKSMHDALAARDHELGLDSGGPLVAIAEDATRPSDAPENSRAVFEVTIDANGDVTGVRVVDASQGRQAWDRIASRMGVTLRSRKIQLRGQHGQSKGLVVTLEVRSRFTLPSGASGGIDPKAVVDGNAPGAQVGFDLSDIGAHATRNIHARILGERAL